MFRSLLLGVLPASLLAMTAVLSTGTDGATDPYRWTAAGPDGDDGGTRRDATGRVTAMRPVPPAPAPATVTGTADDVGADRRSARRVAQAHLIEVAKRFGAQADDLTPTRTNLVPTGATVVFAQRLEGVPVFAGQIAIWVDQDGALLAALGKVARETSGTFPENTAVFQRSGARAAARAVAEQLDKQGAPLPAGALSARFMGPRWLDQSMFDQTPLSVAVPSYAYEVADAGAQVRRRVLVHAPTSTPLVTYDLQPSLNRVVCDAARRIPSNTGPGVRCGKDQPFAVTRDEGGAPSGIPDVDNAYDFLGDTDNLYASLGVDLTDAVGVDYGDGQGKAIRATVRICQFLMCPYANAFWNGEQMAFGEGVTTDDITGHELTHGVTEHDAPLTYLFEAGAINESLSDIFGEFVDLGNGSADDTAANRWLLGEGSSLGVIRSLKDPTQFGDPDRMRSPYWNEDRQMFDSGGVHTNSGVGNKAAFIISDGGTFQGQTVVGIGTGRTAALFNAARMALPTGADYGILAESLRASCAALGYSAAECASVESALLATEMDLEPVSGVPSQAPTCNPGTFPAVVASSDFSTSAGLSMDGRNWVLDSSIPDYRYSKDGNGSAMGVLRSPGSYSMAMGPQLRIPSGATYLRMTHTYVLVLGSLGLPLRSGFVTMERSTDGGASWQSMADLPWINGPTDLTKQGWTGSSGGWQTSRVDLSSLAGQRVKFRWTTHPNGIAPGAWWIDDAALYTCSAQ